MFQLSIARLSPPSSTSSSASPSRRLSSGTTRSTRCQVYKTLCSSPLNRPRCLSWASMFQAILIFFLSKTRAYQSIYPICCPVPWIGKMTYPANISIFLGTWFLLSYLMFAGNGRAYPSGRFLGLSTIIRLDLV